MGVKIDWPLFRRALARMGRLLAEIKAPAGGYAAPRQARHPLLELVMTDAGVRDAIGDVADSDAEAKGVLSWASVSVAGGGVTIRLNHKGRQERCQAALDAMRAALRRIGRRCSFHDLIRHANQNGYLALLRVPDAPMTPVLVR
jgi:hypothetical protein